VEGQRVVWSLRMLEDIFTFAGRVPNNTGIRVTARQNPIIHEFLFSQNRSVRGKRHVTVCTHKSLPLAGPPILFFKKKLSTLGTPSLLILQKHLQDLNRLLMVICNSRLQNFNTGKCIAKLVF